MKVKIRIGNEVKEYTGAREDHTLLEVFQELGITQVHAPCGGNGTCKKCLVTVEGLGEVLSCQTQCKDDMCVTVAEEQKSAIAENGNCYLYPADAGEGLLAACDIGTTTVVCHLLDGATGVRLCTVSAPNAQRSFGADVISRIQASADRGLDKLQSAIVYAGAVKTESGQNRRYPSAGGCRQHGHEPSVLRIVSGEYRCGTFYAIVSVWGKL